MVARVAPDSSARPHRAEVFAALSISIDLGLGLPTEHVLSSSRIAALVADRLDLDAAQRACVYYTNLVLWIGCHADSHEFSRWFGDDLAMRRDSYQLDWSGLPYLWYLLRRTGSHQPPPARARLLLTLMLTPRRRMAALIHSHCLSAGVLAEHIGLDACVREAVQSSFERWDGTGLPMGRRGTDVPLPTRVVQLAETVEVHLRAYGVSRALAMARDRSGTQFDPKLVTVLEGCRAELATLSGGDTWSEALALAPDRDAVLTDAETDALLQAMGDFVDLKCPWTAGHSRAVAALAAGAAARLGLPETDVVEVRRAGYVHDLGRMGVPNSLWEKPGPLTESDRERIRLYPYLTGRILSRVQGLAAECSIAEMHRERLDGSGYPRGLRGWALPMTQRVLAAADSYEGSLEERPHRPALHPAAAATRLRSEAAAGRLDPAAVDAVLTVTGPQARARSQGPAGLTPREVEILALVARGYGVGEVADRLSISTKTVRNHLEHIYTKAGVSNRTAATLFAVEHGLVNRPEDEAPAP